MHRYGVSKIDEDGKPYPVLLFKGAEAVRTTIAITGDRVVEVGSLGITVTRSNDKTATIPVNVGTSQTVKVPGVGLLTVSRYQ